MAELTLKDLIARGGKVEPAAPPQTPPQPAISAPRAGVLGFAQGGTFGFADEIGGLIGQLLVGDGVQIAEPSAQDTPEIRAMKERAIAEQRSGYEIVRDLMREERQQAQEQQPGAYIAGEVGGGVATAFLPGGAGGQVARGGTLAARAGRAALAGAGAGAAYGLGSSEADLTRGEYGRAAADTLAGAAIGAATGAGVQGALDTAIIPLARRGAQAARDTLQDVAARAATKASGYIQKDLKPLIRRDPLSPRERGRFLLEEGIVTPDATVEKIGERLQASADKYGEAIGRVLEAADTVGAKFNMDAFVQRARRELLQPMLVNGQPDPALARVVESLDNLLQQYEGLGNVSFTTANQLKSNLQKLVNWGNQFNESRANLSNEMLIDLQHALLNEIDDQLGAVFERAGAPGQRIRDAFREVKRRYGFSVEAMDKARQGMARQQGNRALSLTDYLAGLGGASAAVATGDVTPLLAAGGLAAGNKLLRERGPSVAASAAHRLAQSQVLQQIAQQSPQLLGKYAPVLQRAALSGERSLATTHYVLSQQDPEYRALMEELLANGEALETRP